MSLHRELSGRERQIIEILYRRERASVRQIRAEMPSPPSYSAVRTTVSIMERKGYVTHAQVGGAYVYSPRITRRQARDGALSHLLATYFDNSVEKAVTAMLQVKAGDLSDADLDRLARLIRKGR